GDEPRHSCSRIEDESVFVGAQRHDRLDLAVDLPMPTERIVVLGASAAHAEIMERVAVSGRRHRNRRAGLCRLLMKRGVLRRGEDLGADEETAQAYEVGELKVLPSLGERPYSLEREQNRFGTDFSARERAVLSEDALDFVPKEALRARVWNREF